LSVYILGISAFYHDSAAAILRDGEIIAAAQEERFTRQKGDARFPVNAVAYCLNEAKITARDINYVVFYEKPLVKFERLLETYLAYSPRGFESFRNAIPLWAKHKLEIPDGIRMGIGPGFKGELLFTDHHESHAASAFFPSPYEEAAILTVDAVGEWGTSSIGTGHGSKITISHELRFPHSLGMLYSAFTYYTGFKVNSGEYKLMGLAPYGKPIYADIIREKLVDIKDDGSLWLDMSYFNYCQGLTMTSEKFHNLFGGPPRSSESMITQKDMDLAASIQVVTEDVLLKMANHTHKVTGMDNLVMAGGVALNCVANGRILRESPFENIWIQPAAGDAGGALGAALLVWHHYLGKPRVTDGKDKQKASLVGPSFSDDEIGLYLDAIGAKYQYVGNEDDLLDQIAQIMEEEKIVGWFQGRMEYGPRALGCRSIIGDARSPQMQQKMNLKIKFRESFRPFAPCVLREYVSDYFEMRENEDSPYMLLVAPVLEKWRIPLGHDQLKKMQDPDLRIRVSVPRSTIPAITHVDYSARVQTVDEERHGRYYRLMKRFFNHTGCPVIVNTSFNIRGEPIVHSPDEAFRCFMATHIDCLVLENYVLLKEDQPQSLIEDIDSYRAQYELD
jgi:carbamoyltransferase